MVRPPRAPKSNPAARQHLPFHAVRLDPNPLHSLRDSSGRTSAQSRLGTMATRPIARRFRRREVVPAENVSVARFGGGAGSGGAVRGGEGVEEGGVFEVGWGFGDFYVWG